MHILFIYDIRTTMEPSHLPCGPPNSTLRRVGGAVPALRPAGRSKKAADAELVQRQSAGALPPDQTGQSFYSIQAFNSQDEAHAHHGEQSGYSQFTDLNVNLIQNYSLN